MYAILDIEATGGKVGSESIIEIAIYKYDGKEILDQFISLVNPSKKIDPYVQKLTNISDKMVITAPKFHEIAKRVVEITQDCILVGHNVTFDYRMLYQEFNRLGYIYERNWIDTFEYAEKLIPDVPSYSLGNLCNSLGIVVTERHRASGDARATCTLFKLLLDKDQQKIIKTKSGITLPKKVNNKYEKLVENLPHKPGLFYLLNSKREIFYVGKSINIYLAVNNLFTGKSKKSHLVKRFTRSIEYELTGSNLLASIKEINEIKKLQPSLNEVNNGKSIYQYGIYYRENKSVFSRLEISKLRNTPLFLAFKTKEEAEKKLDQILVDFKLCASVNKKIKSLEPCFGYTVNTCNGACVQIETKNEYNLRLKELVSKTEYPADSFIIVCKGRTVLEKSFIYIENSIFVGYGYFEYHHQVKNKDRIRKIMNLAEEVPDIKSIIHNYLFRAKENQIIIIDN